MDDSNSCASFLRRLVAFYLAQFFIILASLISVFVICQYRVLNFAPWSKDFWILILVIYLCLYLSDSFFQALLGANLAKYLLGLRIVDQNNKQGLTFVSSLIRSFSSLLCPITFGLGFLAIAFNKDKKSLHDLLSGSKVIFLKRQAFFDLLTTLANIIIGILGSLVFFGFCLLLVLIPLITVKSIQANSYYSSYDVNEFLENRRADLSIKNNHKLSCLIQAKNLEYHDFELDTNSDFNHISLNTASRLGLTWQDLFVNWKEDENKLEFGLLIPKIIFKDLNSKDLTINQVKFILSNKDSISIKQFDIFDLLFNKDSINLKIHEDDQEIINNQNLEDKDKIYLIHQKQAIQELWKNFLQKIDPNISIELLDKIKLSNTLEANLDTKSGLIYQITIPEASSNKAFNTICEEFAKTLPRFRLIPANLQALSSIKFKFSLDYEGKW